MRCTKLRRRVARRGRDLAWDRKVEAAATVRGPEPAGPVASLLEGGLARARIPKDSGSTTRLGGGSWGWSCVLRSSCSIALRYGSGKKKPAFQCAGFPYGQG